MVQVILLALGLVVLYGVRQDKGVGATAAIMAAAGGLLILANVWWFTTWGTAGDSLLPMRGGALGAWLSIVTGAELALLGGMVYWLSREP